MGPGYMNVNVRSVAEAPGLIDALQAEVRAIDPDLPLQRLETMTEVVERAVAPSRFFLVGVAVFAALATLLAAVGLYGVMAYLVSRRSREIGVRVALGASSSSIVRLVMADGLRPTVLGLLVGLALAVAGGRMIESLLFGVDARDPLILCAVPALLTVVAIFAILTPAARASRIDPLRTLTGE
jgi:ABC-type antimicrobial peptide transport system permease subunit